ncbi:hypothetical protein Pta02_77680 [Planobispora takensis]|uniref:Uncharacterized protein n=1 Tax=Planobispora takensis TaxID=1367882 RepID=A0A8J3T7M8_9ACTN|nr:hypothetical protein Pta02_77680 [Planobispora takensis]
MRQGCRRGTCDGPPDHDRPAAPHGTRGGLTIAVSRFGLSGKARVRRRVGNGAQPQPGQTTVCPPRMRLELLPDSTVERVMGVMIDITERRNNEQALRERGLHRPGEAGPGGR